MTTEQRSEQTHTANHPEGRTHIDRPIRPNGGDNPTRPAPRAATRQRSETEPTAPPRESGGENTVPTPHLQRRTRHRVGPPGRDEHQRRIHGTTTGKQEVKPFPAPSVPARSHGRLNTSPEAPTHRPRPVTKVDELHSHVDEPTPSAQMRPDRQKSPPSQLALARPGTAYRPQNASAARRGLKHSERGVLPGADSSPTRSGLLAMSRDARHYARVHKQLGGRHGQTAR